MPGFTTHYLFGLNAFQELKRSELKETIREHHAAYSLGLQGPDLFFYFLPSYTIRRHNIGSIAHTESTGKFLRHLLDSRKLFQNGLREKPEVFSFASLGNRKHFVKTEELRIAEAYIAGFLGHYCLDTQCHPYIYWKTGFQEKNNRYYGRHMSLETDIDKELLRHYRHCLPSGFRQDATIALTRRQAHTIAAILSYVYGKTFPRLGVFHITMHAAIHSIQLGTRFFHDPTGKKKQITEGLEKLLLGHPMLSTMIPSDTQTVHTDPLNLRKKEWKNPWDASLVSHKNFFEMMGLAQQRYLETLSRLEQLYGTPFQAPAGKPGTKRQGTPSLPSHPKELVYRNRLLRLLGNHSYHSGLDAGIPS